MLSNDFQLLPPKNFVRNMYIKREFANKRSNVIINGYNSLSNYQKTREVIKCIRIIKDFLNIFIPFMSSITANVVPRADKTAAVQQISPIQDGK